MMIYDHTIMTARMVKGLWDIMMPLLVCSRCYWGVEESAQGVIVTLVLRPVIPTAVMER